MKKNWKSQAILSVRKSGNHALLRHGTWVPTPCYLYLVVIKGDLFKLVRYLKMIRLCLICFSRVKMILGKCVDVF